MKFACKNTMAKLVTTTTHSYLCMCGSTIGMARNNGFLLDNPKSQGQACDQGLTTTKGGWQVVSPRRRRGGGNHEVVVGWCSIKVKNDVGRELLAGGSIWS